MGWRRLVVCVAAAAAVLAHSTLAAPLEEHASGAVHLGEVSLLLPREPLSHRLKTGNNPRSTGAHMHHPTPHNTTLRSPLRSRATAFVTSLRVAQRRMESRVDNANDDDVPAAVLLQVGESYAPQQDIANLSPRGDIAARVGEAMCQRQLLSQLSNSVWRDIRDTVQESILMQVTTENILKGIILPIGECIAYGIVHELADTVSQHFLSMFEGAFNSIVPDGIQLLFGPLLALYLLKGLGRTLSTSISDPLQIFLNRDLVEIVTVQFMGYLSSQGDPQLQHAVTHVVSDAVAKGAVQAVTHSVTHGITHAVTHTVTHEVIHQYYCIYCHYYNQFCSECYHYADNPDMHRLFQVNVAE